VESSHFDVMEKANWMSENNTSKLQQVLGLVTVGLLASYRRFQGKPVSLTTDRVSWKILG